MRAGSLSLLVLLAACGGAAATDGGSGTDAGTDSGGGGTDSGPAAMQVACLGATLCGGATPVCCAEVLSTSMCTDAGTGGADGGGGVGSCGSTFDGFGATSCEASSAACTSASFACDGAEDCPSGQTCCAAPTGRLATTCQTSACTTMRSAVLAQICHDHTQCPAAFPVCCVLAPPSGPAVDFGFCATAAGASSLDFPVHCDSP